MCRGTNHLPFGDIPPSTSFFAARGREAVSGSPTKDLGERPLFVLSVMHSASTSTVVMRVYMYTGNMGMGVFFRHGITLTK